ncbi:MAG: transporter [Betaproteobacteria bacterium]|nr:transporter [Betaproteobacteria bacterium]
MAGARCTIQSARDGFLVFACWTGTAFAAHPLLTEDTGTQGTGRAQLELTHDLSHAKDDVSDVRIHRFNAVLSVGLAENLDLIAGLPYERLTERPGAPGATKNGVSDMEIAAKWRFYDDGALSFALRPGLGLPTGNEDEGLGAGHATPSVFAVMSYARHPWTFHLHVGDTRNPHRAPDERSHVFHASVAAEHRLGESLRLVGDASLESNGARDGPRGVGSMVFGLVYSVTPGVDVDFGYRKGLTRAAPDQAWLAGIALRF